MKVTKNWFDVDKEGLRSLQTGKPKHYCLRELVANAFDEKITECSVLTSFSNGKAIIVVEDDSPDGFKDISDSFTMFKTTEKRKNPNQRGRFNVGEKQAIVMCDKATIETTKGTVVFDEDGRHMSGDHIDRGSKITLCLKMSRDEYDELVSFARHYLVPKDVSYLVNGESIPYREPFKIVEAKLPTEIERDDGSFGRSERKTNLHVIKTSGKKFLYELGIPILEIDCDYSVDVQQKIPMSIDRETVSPSFLKVVYAEVLNATFDEISPENASEKWVRYGSSDPRISQDAVVSVVKQRWGEKVAVFTPNDPVANDDAILAGYTLVHGSELSKSEWDRIKENDAIKSSHELFGRGGESDVQPVEPNEKMASVAGYAQAIAKKLLDLDILVFFVKSPKDKARAWFELGGNKLTFNVSTLPRKFFEHTVSEDTTSIIIHEIGHYAGVHTSSDYIHQITDLGAKLTMLALDEPSFFDRYRGGKL